MRNRLLASLPSGVLDALQPHLVAVPLQIGQILCPLGAPVEQVHFPEGGIASVIAVAGPHRIEIGLIGREGATGIAAALSGMASQSETIVQVAGSALCMNAATLVRAAAGDEAVRRSLLRFAHLHHVQVAETAIANARSTVEQRLARWLLMAHDRLEHSEFAITHEFLATMLGVRRPGVTVALHVLEGEHAIRSRRSSITILDRAKLKAVAGPVYGVAERLYADTFPGFGFGTERGGEAG